MFFCVHAVRAEAHAISRHLVAHGTVADIAMFSFPCSAVAGCKASCIDAGHMEAPEAAQARRHGKRDDDPCGAFAPASAPHAVPNVQEHCCFRCGGDHRRTRACTVARQGSADVDAPVYRSSEPVSILEVLDSVGGPVCRYLALSLHMHMPRVRCIQKCRGAFALQSDLLTSPLLRTSSVLIQTARGGGVSEKLNIIGGQLRAFYGTNPPFFLHNAQGGNFNFYL